MADVNYQVWFPHNIIIIYLFSTEKLKLFKVRIYEALILMSENPEQVFNKKRCNPIRCSGLTQESSYFESRDNFDLQLSEIKKTKIEPAYEEVDSMSSEISLRKNLESFSRLNFNNSVEILILSSNKLLDYYSHKIMIIERMSKYIIKSAFFIKDSNWIVFEFSKPIDKELFLFDLSNSLGPTIAHQAEKSAFEALNIKDLIFAQFNSEDNELHTDKKCSMLRIPTPSSSWFIKLINLFV